MAVSPPRQGPKRARPPVRKVSPPCLWLSARCAPPRFP